MYLAPLNYDPFFKKVFSEISISKAFLEDFFDVTIESIEALPNKHKITDDAENVEFDFRCKINGQYVIIDMQQWYKTDIVKRFYLYHTLNTALQVRNLPPKTIAAGDFRQRETRDYDYLEPVITLIWMADDSMGFTDDYISYVLTPEMLSLFLEDSDLWRENNFFALLEQRENLLQILNNKTKQLPFLSQNKLIYAFQPNVVRNKKIRCNA